MGLNDLEHLFVDTPENVVFEYKLAGIGSRFFAAFLDNLIIVVIQILMIILTTTLEIRNAPVLVALVSFISFVIIAGYYIFFEGTQNGKSPGKARMGLRVVKLDGTPITMEEAILRNLLRLIDFLPAYYALGVLIMFFDKSSRRLGDFVAGTVVIIDQDHRQTLEQSIDNANTPLRRDYPPNASLDSFISELPIGKLGKEDFKLLEGYIQRRSELANPEYLAAQIFDRIKSKLEIAAIPFDIPIGQFLESLYYFEYFRQYNSNQ